MNRLMLRIGQSLFLIMALTLFFSANMRADDAATTFKAKCAPCHGPDGSGSTSAGEAMKVRDFHSPEVQKETDAELADIISNGRNKMPKYADKLKPAEIKDLAAYVHELGKK